MSDFGGRRASWGLFYVFLQDYQAANLRILFSQQMAEVQESERNHTSTRKASAFAAPASILLAKVSPMAIPKVNGAEMNILPFLEKDTAKSNDKGCGCIILLQGGSEDLGIINLLHS